LLTCSGDTTGSVWNPSYSRLATQKFLRLSQPLDGRSRSEGTVAGQNIIHQFQFLFKVPSGLLPQVCQHACEYSDVQSYHLQLPPSLGLGKRTGISSMFSHVDPDAVTITYSVRFQATEINLTTNQPCGIIDTAHRIFILPSLEEMPPLLVLPVHCDYQLSKWVILRSLLRRSIGNIIVTANQPKPIQLRVSKSQLLQPTTTSLPLYLEYRPACRHRALPRITTIRSKLRVKTYYGVDFWDHLPGQAIPDRNHPLHRLFWRDVSLPSRKLTTTEWTAGGCADKCIYNIPLSLPIALPGDVLYVPTFFSCLVSRVYALTVEIIFEHPELILGSSVTLTVPIQICSA
jgi:hypothetical protein